MHLIVLARSLYANEILAQELEQTVYAIDVTTINLCLSLFKLSTLQTAQLYKRRWQVELFFKWIKQSLRVKAFVGHSANAVKSQIWIAVTSYVLVAIIKKRLNVSASLHCTLQVLRLHLFESTPLPDLFNNLGENDLAAPCESQFSLFEKISGQ